MNNLHDFVDSIIENGGATFNLSTGTSPTSGYAVSLKGGSKTPIDETRQSIEQTIKEFISIHGLELSMPENNIGGWVDDGWLYLDVSIIMDNLSDAILMGKINKQKAIFNLDDGHSIDL
jgi:hypothetical protein